MEQNTLVYPNLKSISAVLFHEIKFSGNIYLVDKNWQEGKKYESSEIIDINNAWLNLYDEYFEKSDDPKLRKALRGKTKTLELSLKIVNVQKIIEIIESIDKHSEYMPNNVVKDVLKGLADSLHRIEKRIKLHIDKPIKNQLKHLYSVLGGLQTKYKVQFKKEMNVSNSDIMMFYEMKAEIERILERNLDENVNMLQWVAYEKQYKRKVKQLMAN